jgi:hypothetical protein
MTRKSAASDRAGREAADRIRKATPQPTYRGCADDVVP